MKILVVEDEKGMAQVLRRGLEEDNHAVSLAYDGLSALSLAEDNMFDLVLLDVMLPGIDGIQVAQRVRQLGQDIPILMLTARDSVPDIVKGLDAGADDYVTKPFSIQELLARVRAHLRRAPERAVDAPLEIGDFVVDASAHTAMVGGKSLHLTPTEFDLLLFMARNAGKALTHRALLTAVWGGQSAHQPEYLRVFIGQLRRKLEAEGPRQYIQTEPWVGYRFLPEGVPE
jgi:two-component system KDP operon response regulator KdpE